MAARGATAVAGDSGAAEFPETQMPQMAADGCGGTTLRASVCISLVCLRLRPDGRSAPRTRVPRKWGPRAGCGRMCVPGKSGVSDICRSETEGAAGLGAGAEAGSGAA